MDGRGCFCGRYSTLTQFGVATNDYRGGSEHSEYHTVVTWDRLAEICGQYLYSAQTSVGPATASRSVSRLLFSIVMFEEVGVEAVRPSGHQMPVGSHTVRYGPPLSDVDGGLTRPQSSALRTSSWCSRSHLRAAAAPG